MKNKNIIKPILITLGVLLVIGIGITIISYNMFYKMNEMITIKEDNITLTVQSIEEYTIEEDFDEDMKDLGFTSFIDGDYYRVKVEITNNANEVYEHTALNFSLTDNEGNVAVPSIALSEEDVENLLPSRISSKQTISGYIYFPIEDDKEFEKPAYFTYTSYSNIDTPKYRVLLLK